MAKAVLSWINHVDAAATILTASDTAGDLSISNVADAIVGRRHRTTDLTSWGQADFGANKTVGLVVLVFARDQTMPTAGTIRHQFDPDGGTPGTGATHDSTAISTGVIDGYGYHIYKPATAFSARYWRWTYAITGVTFVDLGRAWAGEAWQPTFNIVLGYDDEWGDRSRVVAAERSGAEFVDERAKQRFFAFGLNALSASEKDEIREMQRLVGVSGQIIFIKDPDSPAKDTVLGRLAASTPIRHSFIPIYSKAFTLRESL